AKMPTWQKRYWQEMGASEDFIAQQEREYERIHGTGHADHEPADDEPENPFLKYLRRPKVSKVVEGQEEAPPGEDGRDDIDDIVEDTLAQDEDGQPAADGGSNDHPAHNVARLLVQSGSHKTHEDALAYLLHNPRGAAMLRRLTKHEDQPTMTDYKTKLYDLA